MSNINIYQFIQNLNESEINLVHTQFESNRPIIIGESQQTKELQLFEIILKNKNTFIDDEFIQQLLPSGRLDMLKQRLLEKVFEAISSDKNISNKKLFNEFDRHSFITRKQLLTCKVLIRSQNHGKTAITGDLLDKIISTAREFEIYDVLTDALITKKYFLGIRQGLQKFEEIEKEVEFAEFCLKSVYFANDAYFKLILNNDFINSLSKKEIDTLLKNSIKKISSDYKKSKSQQLNYYLHILEFALCERNKDYIGAISYCNKLLKILKSSPVIFRSERMGFILDNLSFFNTFIENYDVAAKNAKNAQLYYQENSLNYAISLEQEFHIHFYSGDYPKAEKCLNRLKANNSNNIGSFRIDKYSYFSACILFSIGKFKEALAELKSTLEIEKDKTRWNINIRVLVIMIFVELKKFDEASNAIESLRKHIERNLRKEDSSTRNIEIIKTLREIEKGSFLFNATNSILSHLEILSSKDEDAQWLPLSTELIPFHRWVEANLKTTKQL